MMWGNQFQRVSPEARFWARVQRGADDDCWPWTGAITKSTGYGTFTVGEKNFGAHRYSYELCVGPIADGATIDHRCHTDSVDCTGGASCPHRACVNPAHLEPVTRGENTLRGLTLSAANVVKTHCPNNHEYTPENTYRLGNRRHCRTCHRDRERIRRAAKYAALAQVRKELV